MTQPQMALIYCNECNERYDSEQELWEHMKTSHRGFVSEQSAFQDDGAQTDSVEEQLGSSKEKWAKISAKLRDRVQARFDSEELDVIDRFIRFASQSSIFDDVCR